MPSYFHLEVIYVVCFCKFRYLCSNRLNGSIPSELRNLSSLQNLNIRINSLSGGIPDELWNISSLMMLDLNSNQLDGQLQKQLEGLRNLQAIYLMNNNFSGELPPSIGNLTNLLNFNIQGNNFNGAIPESITVLQNLKVLWLMGNDFQGPFPSNISTNLTHLAVTGLTGGETGYPFPDIQLLTLLRSLTLRNCLLVGPIPDYIWNLPNLTYLDLSFNSLSGKIPATVKASLQKLFLRRNNLSDKLPGWVSNSKDIYVDVSENFFTNVTPSTGTESPNLNLFACCSNISNMDMKWQDADYYCANNTLSSDHLYINCGGNATWINGSYYEADLQPNGGSTFVLSDNKAWAYSSMGTFLYADNDQYQFIVNKSCNISMADAPLYTGARVSPISLKYYGFCLRNDRYTVRLHFAEIGWETTTDYSFKKNRVFDVEIQGHKVLRDFNIEEAAGGLNKDITMEFNVSVNGTRLEIHLYWSGKGSTTFPTKYYGPLISAISVSPVPRKHRTFSHTTIAAIAGTSLILAVLIITLLRMIGWIGGKNGVELYPGGLYNIQQIRAAVNNFDPKNKIGKGRGTVYKGELPGGREIAVKQLSPKSEQNAREIIKEIFIIFAIDDHTHIARPLGYCAEKKQILLVYEYMENISLEHILFHKSSEVTSTLNWQTRVKICLGMAKGLAFLHEDSKPALIHGNIKPSNILLGKDFDVKISDFAYSQLYEAQSNEEETTCGNLPRAKITGYMAPEYILGQHLRPEVDVYSFGIITLEILSGKNIVTPSSKDQNIYLLTRAYLLQQQNNLIALLDQRLERDYKTNEANKILELAMGCVNTSSALRPTMSHAVKVLQGEIELKTSANVPPPSHDSKMAEPIASLPQSTQSGCASHEGSSTTIPLSTSKEIDDDSIISVE